MSKLNEGTHTELIPYEEELEMVRKVRNCIDIMHDDKQQSQPHTAALRKKKGKINQKEQLNTIKENKKRSSVLKKLEGKQKKLQGQDKIVMNRKKNDIII